VAQGKVSDNLRLTLSNPDDYQVSTTQGSLTVTPATVNVSGRNTTSTYTALVQTNTYTASGLVGTDALTVTGMASATDVRRNGAAGVMAYADSLRVTLPSANYLLGTVTDGSLTINPAPLTVAGQNTTVVYNGAVQSNAAPNVTGLLGTDTAAGAVSVTGLGTGTRAGSYADSFALSGPRSGNYVISSSTPGALRIDPASLRISGKTTSKAYSGTTQMNDAATITGLQGSDGAAVSGYAQARNVSAGTQSDDLKVALAHPGDYTVAITNGSLTITPYRLSTSGGSSTAPGLAASASNKVYDGNTTATGSVTPVLFAGDTLVASASSASFDTKNAGTGKTVTFSGLSLSGDATTLANYSLGASPMATTTASITSASGGDEAAKVPLVLPETAASSAAVASRAAPIISVLVVRQSSTEVGGIVVVYVPKELATSGQGFSFRIPDSLFNAATETTATDTNPAAPARATLVNGEPLPRWLSFDPQTKVISASAVPDRGFPVEVVITEGRKVVTVVVSERASGT
jgi:hypothetical protein